MPLSRLPSPPRSLTAARHITKPTKRAKLTKLSRHFPKAALDATPRPALAFLPESQKQDQPDARSPAHAVERRERDRHPRRPGNADGEHVAALLGAGVAR